MNYRFSKIYHSTWEGILSVNSECDYFCTYLIVNITNGNHPSSPMASNYLDANKSSSCTRAIFRVCSFSFLANKHKRIEIFLLCAHHSANCSLRLECR